MARNDDQFPPLPGGRKEEENRAAPRFTLLIRAAKLVIDENREFLCVIRDVSSTGLKARLFNPLPANSRSIAIEMSNGDRHAVEVMWQQGDFAGFRFINEISVERLLDDGHGTYPKRQVRLRIRLNAILHSGGEAVRVSFKDISQQGASIDCDKWLLMNELVRIETGVLPPIYAKVRWRSHPRYGLLFEHTFQLAELAQISAALQPDGDETPQVEPRNGEASQ